MKCSFCGSTDNKVDVINYGGKIVTQCVECKDFKELNALYKNDLDNFYTNERDKD